MTSLRRTAAFAYRLANLQASCINAAGEEPTMHTAVFLHLSNLSTLFLAIDHRCGHSKQMLLKPQRMDLEAHMHMAGMGTEDNSFTTCFKQGWAL